MTYWRFVNLGPSNAHALVRIMYATMNIHIRTKDRLVSRALQQLFNSDGVPFNQKHRGNHAYTNPIYNRTILAVLSTYYRSLAQRGPQPVCASNSVKLHAR